MLDYSLEFELYGCSYDIRVNDGPVFSDPDGAPGRLALPVNAWLQTGENRLTAIIRPLPAMPDFDERTQISLMLIAPDPTSVSGIRSLARLSASLDQVRQTAEQEGQSKILRLETTFWVAEDIPVWRWQLGQLIPESGIAKDALIQELLRFHTYLAKQDLSGVSEFLADRDIELAAAMNITLNEKQQKSTNDFKKLMDTHVFELDDFETDYLQLEVFGYGRLARLDAYDGGPPIIYSGKLEPIYVRLPLIFYQPATHAWRVIR